MKKAHARFLEIDEEISRLHDEAITLAMREVWPMPVNGNLRDSVLFAANRAVAYANRDGWTMAIDAVLAMFDPDDDGDAYRDPDGIREKIAALRREKA